METATRRTLPENAYRPLKPGESYVPVVPAGVRVPEWTARSVVIGLVMAVVFSAAAAFLGFKVGQVFEAAIPIAILAVGIGVTLKRRSTILENVIIQSIGAASGLIVAGSIFTLPALFIIGLPVDLFKLFLVALFGGILGVLFLIPLRRYFVKEMHGELPFPEATATTEVLVAGESGGQQAVVLAVAAVIGGIFDFLVIHFSAFAEVFTTRSVPFLAGLASKAKLVFKLDVLASVVGLGYIIGLRYSAVICAGSFVSWFLLVPLFGWVGDALTVPLGSSAAGALVSQMNADQIFRTYVRLIGIGGIACAGLLGILRSWRIIASAFGLGFKELLGKKAADAVQPERTDTRSPDEDRPGRHPAGKRRDAGLLHVRGSAAAAQLLRPCDHRAPGRVGDLVPVHDRVRASHRDGRHEPGLRHDADDLDPRLGDPGRGGPHGQRRDAGGAHDRRGRLHRALDRGWLRHRPEDRLLDRRHPGRAAALQAAGEPRRRTHRGVRDAACSTRCTVSCRRPRHRHRSRLPRPTPWPRSSRP